MLYMCTYQLSSVYIIYTYKKMFMYMCFSLSIYILYMHIYIYIIYICIHTLLCGLCALCVLCMLGVMCMLCCACCMWEGTEREPTAIDVRCHRSLHHRRSALIKESQLGVTCTCFIATCCTHIVL